MAATIMTQQQQLQAGMGQQDLKGWKAQLKLPPKDSRKKTSDVTGSPCTEWSKRSWHHHCKPLSHIL